MSWTKERITELVGWAIDMNYLGGKGTTKKEILEKITTDEKIPEEVVKEVEDRVPWVEDGQNARERLQTQQRNKEKN